MCEWRGQKIRCNSAMSVCVCVCVAGKQDIQQHQRESHNTRVKRVGWGGGDEQGEGV